MTDISNAILLFAWHEGRFAGRPSAILKTSRGPNFARGQAHFIDTFVFYDVDEGRVIEPEDVESVTFKQPAHA